MAGGSGERFWPLSRRRKPKQLLSLASDKTMIEDSIERISPLIEPDDVYIITGELLLEPLRGLLKDVPPENIVAEPHKRNTAPCLALATAFIAAKYEGKYPLDQISTAVLTADQIITPAEGFRKTVEATLDYVEENSCLGTIGILPSRPDTGYGYVHVENEFDYSTQMPEVTAVKAFKEKPDKETARKYVESGKYLWNSGMFFWRLDVFSEKMKKYFPEVGEKIDYMKQKYIKKTNIAIPEPLQTIAGVFEKFPNVSIDYGLMEKVDNVVASKALFDWDDVGSWTSLERTKNTDEEGNITEGDTVLVDSEESIVINSSKDGERIVVGLGLNDIVVVSTDDAVLVCPKSKAQDVKKAVEEIKKINGEKKL